ncbi:MAG: methylenetetrahydrofolate reductase [NAD(P)H] [Peptoanaerobacter stomatis]
MKISDILSKNKINLSFEVFPPKSDVALGAVMDTVRDIADLKPAFCSVTYGANGGTSENTVKIASYIENELNVCALAHLTCVLSSKEDIDEKLQKLKEHNIDNILALRGDIIDEEAFKNKKDLIHSSELMSYIKDNYDFCIGGACYPEGHLESKSKDEDVEYLKLKQDLGADFLTTQMFFDNNIFYNFMYKLRNKNVNIPIIPGIMPVTNVTQLKRIKQLSGAQIPPKFLSIADKFKDDVPAMKQAGIIYACNQIIDLISNGINHIHVYTMNDSDIAKRISDNLSYILEK